jgi:hypothetical protein
MTLKQIDVFDTIIGKLMNDDPNIKSIKVYGTKKNPLFVTSDVLRYIQDTKYPAQSKKCKYFIEGKEKLSETVVYPQKHKNGKDYTTEQKVCLLTSHGLIRCLTFCNKPTVAATCFRQLVYAIFDHVNESRQMEAVISTAKESIETKEVQVEIEQISNKEGVVYFIKQENLPYTKVGWTTLPIEKHLQNLQVGNPNKLIVYNYFYCDSIETESKIHEEYQDFHHRGEWFNLNKTQIKNIIKKYNYILT